MGSKMHPETPLIAQAQGVADEREAKLEMALIKVECNPLLWWFCTLVSRYEQEFRRPLEITHRELGVRGTLRIGESPLAGFKGMCCSKRTVARTVDQAETLGLVQVHRVVGKQNEQKPNKYQIDQQGVQRLLAHMPTAAVKSSPAVREVTPAPKQLANEDSELIRLELLAAHPLLVEAKEYRVLPFANARGEREAGKLVGHAFAPLQKSHLANGALCSWFAKQLNLPSPPVPHDTEADLLLVLSLGLQAAVDSGLDNPVAWFVSAVRNGNWRYGVPSLEQAAELAERHRTGGYYRRQLGPVAT